jgi:hypothetical protein
MNVLSGISAHLSLFGSLDVDDNIVDLSTGSLEPVTGSASQHSSTRDLGDDWAGFDMKMSALGTSSDLTVSHASESCYDCWGSLTLAMLHTKELDESEKEPFVRRMKTMGYTYSDSMLPRDQIKRLKFCVRQKARYPPHSERLSAILSKDNWTSFGKTAENQNVVSFLLGMYKDLVKETNMFADELADSAEMVRLLHQEMRRLMCETFTDTRVNMHAELDVLVEDFILQKNQLSLWHEAEQRDISGDIQGYQRDMMEWANMFIRYQQSVMAALAHRNTVPMATITDLVKAQTRRPSMTDPSDLVPFAANLVNLCTSWREEVTESLTALKDRRVEINHAFEDANDRVDEAEADVQMIQHKLLELEKQSKIYFSSVINSKLTADHIEQSTRVQRTIMAVRPILKDARTQLQEVKSARKRVSIMHATMQRPEPDLSTLKEAGVREQSITTRIDTHDQRYEDLLRCMTDAYESSVQKLISATTSQYCKSVQQCSDTNKQLCSVITSKITTSMETYNRKCELIIVHVQTFEQDAVAYEDVRVDIGAIRALTSLWKDSTEKHCYDTLQFVESAQATMLMEQIKSVLRNEKRMFCDSLE